MKNGNDNLKEKAMDPKELESISGGRCWAGSYRVYASICYGSNCKAALCVSNCCHPGAVTATEKPNPNNPNGNCYVAEINQDICTGCGSCDSLSACSNKAMQFEFNLW